MKHSDPRAIAAAAVGDLLYGRIYVDFGFVCSSLR